MATKLELAVLSRIPRHPDKIDTTTLLERLQAAGIETNVRALQRLLVTLESNATIRRHATGKPHQWSFAPNEYVEYPPMTAETALSIVMAFDHMRHLLPPATLADLKPRERHARNVLKASTAYAKWRFKVRVAPRGIAFVVPTIEPAVLKTVYQALFEGRQFTVEYKRRGKNNYQHFDVNPVGIVVRDGIVSLVSTRSGTTSWQQLHLHRMRNAELTNRRASVPAGFELDAHVARGNVGFKLSPEPIELELLVTKMVADTLAETKLSKDQSIEQDAGDLYRVRGTIPDTVDLRGWLKSYGAHIEVVAPPGLRKQIASELRRAAEQYSSE